MELDELKSFINERMMRTSQQKSAAEIAVLLGGKTQSVVGKIRRSLFFEIGGSIAFALICLAVVVFSSYTWLRTYFGIFAALYFMFIPLLLLLYKKVNQLGATVLPVKSNLQMLVKILKEYIKRYFQFTMALIPVCILIALWLGYSDRDWRTDDGITSLQITIFIAYILFFVTGMYFFTKWYLKKLYGNYIQQLEVLISELEATD